jgi:UDP-N-acetylglucosamine--N-acetylmuramyl-(pentapeptide) pyrophosphoryl-undecaprenol N-acetylglucosamine transferase
MTSKTIILAAGGTGGHLYPAEALAQELLNRGHKVVIVTDKRGTAFKSLGDKVQILTVRAATFKAGLFSKIKAVRDILIGIVQAAVVLKKIRPAVIIGFGGYPSYPTMFAAQQMGFKTILHEQNAILGKANLHLADKAIAIAASLPDTRNIKPVNQSKVTVTGNPVRAAVCAVRDLPYLPPTDTFEIFITGGSQAAKVFGEIVPDATARLPDDLRKRLHVVHQCREDDIAATTEKYRIANVTAEIKSFFNDMPERLSACHLFIGRSGASTVAEIAVVGRPAIFVPLWHADRQQFLNADLIANKKGAWVMEQNNFTPAALAERLESLIRDPAQLEKAAAAAKACGQPGAVRKLADLVEKNIQ